MGCRMQLAACHWMRENWCSRQPGTYAPLIARILPEWRHRISGMVHCSGGAQTKVLHFVDDVHVIKDQLFETPPLFKIIQSSSGTDWKEMYKVFNMGHRMEIYYRPKSG